MGTLVAASVDPAQLALRLLGEEVIGRDAAQRAARIEWGDAVLVIYTALDGPVEYAAGRKRGLRPTSTCLRPPSKRWAEPRTNAAPARFLRRR